MPGPSPFAAHLLAKASVRGAVRASLVSSSPYIYVTGSTFVYALNASTLEQVWKVKIGSNLASTPAVSGGSVYIGSSDGNVYSLDALTGGINWRFATGGAVYSSPVVDSGRVIVGSDDSKVYALDAPTGALVWSFQTGGRVRSSPAVNGVMVMVGSDDGNFYIILKSVGLQLLKITTGGPIESSPSFAGKVVYFGSNDTKVYAANADTGQLIWQKATGGPVLAPPVDTLDGRVVVGSTDGTLYSLNATNGQLTWKEHLGAISAPVSLGLGVNKLLLGTYEELAYVSSLNGMLYGVQTKTGDVIWSMHLAGPLRAAPTLAYSKLYIGDALGNVYQIGQLRFATPVDTFNQADQNIGTFPADGFIRIGANVAWGKFGINRTLLTIYAPGPMNDPNVPIFVNASMTFYPAQTAKYNLFYDWNYTGQHLQPGNYKFSVLVEDAHSKVGTPHSRCCGWVNFKGDFVVA